MPCWLHSVFPAPLKGFISLLQVILLTAFSIPARADTADKSKTRASNIQPALETSALAKAKMSLYQLQTRTSLATKAALSALNPPSEFSLLKSRFEEPLIATGPSSPEEDAALLRTLRLFRDRAVEDDLSSLTNFVANSPKSPWRVSLLTNLGLLDYNYGYFGEAIVAWSRAWLEGKSVSEPKGKLLVDRAAGELARMHARLGHADALEALFKDIGDRPIAGGATEAITGAHEGLAVMRKDPGIAYLCGPMALKNLLLSMRRSYKQVEFLDAVRSGPHGVSLSEVSLLADQAKLPHRVVFRDAGQPVPVPSIIHWKVSHFAAIVGSDGKRFHVADPTFGTDLWVTQAAIDDGSDGYFLVPSQSTALAWRDATPAESSNVRGMGYPGGVETGDHCFCSIPAQGGQAGSTPSNPKMAGYRFTEMLVNLNITDTPVGYAPPKGPSAYVTLAYNQRESDQPATFSYFNLGQKWTLNWLSYIEDDPRQTGARVARYVAGGGYIDYFGYSNGIFTPEPRDASVLSRSTSGAITYKRALADGSMEIYSASNGATTYPRLVFLTQITDSAGNSVNLSYDNQQRLTSFSDSTGRLTTFSYELEAQPLLITKITDPFGRSAQIAYDSNGRLSQITDILGIQSHFTYDSSSLINAMTTPYGTTTFTYGQNGTYRYLTATDPLQQTERLEYYQPAPPNVLPFSEPASLVPHGIISPFNEYITGRDTFYWDKHAHAVAAGDYTKARIRHWMHLNVNNNEMYHQLESVKYPFENRVWYNYPNQSSTGFSGSLDSPIRIGRVLDDGTSQLSKMSYNALGHPTDMIDPAGRETQFTYDSNQIDLLAVKQKTSALGYSTIAQFSYNPQHLPLTYTDTAGQITRFQYNAAGQLLQMTDALGETTSYQYDGMGYLTSIINANGQTQASFVYDPEGRVATATDSEGYAVTYAYDAANRVVQETFPDETTRKYAWTNLDLTSVTDRQGNVTKYGYDPVRDLLSTTDPMNHITKLGYWENQSLKTLTDPNGNTTTWNIDIQNRVTAKQFADGTQVINAYENTTSRLHAITDAVGQVKTLTYGNDDTLSGIAYTRAVNATPNVSFSYDPYFRRISSMADGTGIRIYFYQPVGLPGALQLALEASPDSNSLIEYRYDALSRLAARTVDISTETFTYDNLSRLVTHGTPMGSFNLAYLGQTGQITNQQISTGTVSTSWLYDTNTNDRRLQSITNSGATRSYNFTTTPENLITQIRETAPNGSAFSPQTWDYTYDNSYRLTNATSAGVYRYGLDAADNITSYESPTGTTPARYNNLNQMTEFGSQQLVHDANGNLLSDGTRTYGWDAENRLIEVTNAARPFSSTRMSYDGLGRRVTISSHDNEQLHLLSSPDVSQAHAGNKLIPSAETRYLWCGEMLCQARDGNDVVTHRYFAEGELIPQSNTSMYYAQDQLGSVRDSLSIQDGSRLGSLNYDPYGSQIQASGIVNMDFRYAGLFYEREDNLYLASHRVYDSNTGRWLSRDPMGETGGVNLHEYAGSNPASAMDSTGSFCVTSIESAYCTRSAVYAQLEENPAIARKTDFFYAAATVTAALSTGTVPLATDEYDFLNNLSQTLFIANIGRAGLIAAGQIYGNGSISQNDQAFVNFEQCNVQVALNSLESSNSGLYQRLINDLNDNLNNSVLNSIDIPFDPAFQAGLARTEADLGRPFDFANINDRILLGNNEIYTSVLYHLYTLGR